MSLSKLIKELDIVFSRFIRQKYSNSSGFVKCFTCPAVLRWQEIQNGHFIRRRNMIVRFDENNCRPQCKQCNEDKDGNIEVYRMNLISEIGLEEVERIERLGRSIQKYFAFELKEKIDYYKPLLKWN